MPQITKVRIVNFLLNDGNRLIADELFDFESESKESANTLINLANGGGKSVLVQLMMQPILPKAKVQKRRIESFFTKPTDHSFVVLEWALDNSRQKLMTGIALAASDSSNNQDAERGVQIKYYTFLSQYEIYQGDCNIISLPLSSKENGKFVPAAFDAVRAFSKRSGSPLERYSSDDNPLWQSRLAEYGIVPSEWRLIEELNSNEDGLSSYFESLKKSDALIDKFIIPRIEEKQTQSASKEDSSLETMLISYAKQFSKQQEIIREGEILTGFCGMLETARGQAESLWNAEDAYKGSIGALFAYADALGQTLNRLEDSHVQLEEKQRETQEQMRHIRWEKESASYYEHKEDLDKKEALCQKASVVREDAAAQHDAAENTLRRLECARYYGQLKEIEAQFSAVCEEIARRESEGESGSQLAILKYSARRAIQQELESVQPELEQKEAEAEAAQASVENLASELRKAETRKESANAEVVRLRTLFDKQLADNDAAAASLAFASFRMLDGRYPECDIATWRKEKDSQIQTSQEAITSANHQYALLEARREELPQKIADQKNVLREKQAALGELNQQITEYEELDRQVAAICQRWDLDYENRFSDQGRRYLTEQAESAEAEAAKDSRKIEAIEEELASIGRGTLHIPKAIGDFLNDSGCAYISIEKYLLKQQEAGHFSPERVIQFLDRYPHAAYGILVDDAALETLQEEAVNRWLPAVLPVFTDKDMVALLDESAEGALTVSAYARDYFQNPTGFQTRMEAQKSSLSAHLQMLTDRKNALESDLRVLTSFSEYDSAWLSKNTAERHEQEAEIEREIHQIAALEEELTNAKLKLAQLAVEIKDQEENLRQLQVQQSAYEAFVKDLEQEAQLEQALYEAEGRLRDARDAVEDSKKLLKEAEVSHQALSGQAEALQLLCARLREGERKVDGAEETTEFYQDSWESLLQRYNALLEVQNADLKRLNEDRTRLEKDRGEKEKELRQRDLSQEAYEGIVYTEKSEDAARTALKDAETRHKEAASAYSEAAQAMYKAEAYLEAAKNALEPFGGEPLPKSDVGRAFEARLQSVQTELRQLDAQRAELEKRISALQRAQSKTEMALERCVRPQTLPVVALEEDFEGQRRRLGKAIEEREQAVRSAKKQVDNTVQGMDRSYSGKSENVRQAVSNMHRLLTDESVSGDRYYTLCEHIETNLHITQLRIAQIDTDLKEFNKTKEDLLHQCTLQGRMVYEGLRRIESNSKLKIQDRRRAMLRFGIPEQVDEHVAKTAIAAELEKGTEEIVRRMAADDTQESELRKLAQRTVGSKRLLRSYIGKESIQIKAYKIDRNPENSDYRTWEDTQVKNSGAEKFVVYLAVILALMAYARDAYEGIGGEKNRSVLILDNPFGPISSKHVLEPMFDIARNYHVQMICLSDIGKSDILSCFDLVIRAVVRKFSLNSKEWLTHEGNETIEHGFYRSEQLKLTSKS